MCLSWSSLRSHLRSSFMIQCRLRNIWFRWQSMTWLWESSRRRNSLIMLRSSKVALSLTYLKRMSRCLHHVRRREDHYLIRQSGWKYVTWEMGVGHIIILLLRFRQGSIDHLRLLLEFLMVQVLIYGHSLVWSLRWLLEISCLSHDLVLHFVKMTIIWPKWLNCLVRFLDM